MENKLIELMRLHGINQNQLAKRLGITRAAVNNYVKGRRQVPAIVWEILNETP